MFSNQEIFDPLLGPSTPLSVPLLGDEEVALIDDDGFDCEDHDAAMEDEAKAQGSVQSWISCVESLVAGIVLPGLLWMNFCLALWAYQGSAGAISLSFGTVHLSFALFLVAVTLYRRMSEECQFQSVAAILLPEATMTVVLVLVLWGEISSAFAALIVGTLLLSVCGVANSLHWLLSNRRDDECHA